MQYNYECNGQFYIIVDVEWNWWSCSASAGGLYNAANAMEMLILYGVLHEHEGTGHRCRLKRRRCGNGGQRAVAITCAD